MVTIDLEKAKEKFKDSPEWLKNEFIAKFGLENLTDDILEKIGSSFEAAYKLASEKTKKEYDDSVNANTPDHMKALAELILIIDVANEDAPEKNRVWFPVFIRSSGSAFDSSHCSYATSGTILGSRFCLESQIKSSKIGTNFNHIYKRIIIKN